MANWNFYVTKWMSLGLVSVFGAAALGCSALPIGMAMHIAGEVVNDVDQSEKEKEFVGLPVGAADERLGSPVDVYVDDKSKHEWRVYPVSLDPLGNSRYVLESARGKVIAFKKIQKDSDVVKYEAVMLILRPKVMGRSPAQCQAELDMGPPKLTVRSRNTGALVQLFDARMVQELQSPHYCIVWYGMAGLCDRVELVKAYEEVDAGGV